MVPKATRIMNSGEDPSEYADGAEYVAAGRCYANGMREKFAAPEETSDLRRDLQNRFGSTYRGQVN